MTEPILTYRVECDDLECLHLGCVVTRTLRRHDAETASTIRALVRDTTRPEHDRLADLDALAGRLEGEGD